MIQSFTRKWTWRKNSKVYSNLFTSFNQLMMDCIVEDDLVSLSRTLPFLPHPGQSP